MDAVAAMLDLLRDPEEIFKHVTDAMIAQQLPPIARERWLERCEDGQTKAERVTAAQSKLRQSSARTVTCCG